MDCDMSPPVSTKTFMMSDSRDNFLPPRIASTDLLPVLIISTRRRRSCTSIPVANEEPYVAVSRDNNVHGTKLLP